MQKRLFLLAVALLILVPATGALTGLGAMSEQEMRDFEGRRKTAFAQDFPKWFTDNLGMRRHFLNAYASVLLFGFGQSSNPEQVQVGQKGFLFLGDRYMKTFSAHSGVRATKDISLHLGTGFKSLITLFQENGIPVLVAIAPDKATIYAEYYPKWVKHVSRSFPRENFTDSELLKRHTLFLEDILLEYKNQTDYLYLKNDSHWNSMGAFLGYTAIMDGLEKLTGKKLDRFPLLAWKTIGPIRGDLERMNRIAEEEENTRIPVLLKKDYQSVTKEKIKNFSKYSNKNSLNPLTVAIIRDSFYSVIPAIYRITFNTTYETRLTRLDRQTLEALLAGTPPIDLLVFLLVERTVPEIDTMLKRLAREVAPRAAP